MGERGREGEGEREKERGREGEKERGREGEGEGEREREKERERERRRGRGGCFGGTDTNDQSITPSPGPRAPPRCVRAAHASHFMNSISTGRNFQFERAIITAWGDSVNCFCSIMHSDAIIFLSNYRGVSAACHPGADFQFN